MAICGGVNYIGAPTMFVQLSKTKMLSPTGQSRAFSADADGYVRGEGCGIVVLKRLKDVSVDWSVRIPELISTSHFGHKSVN